MYEIKCILKCKYIYIYNNTKRGKQKVMNLINISLNKILTSRVKRDTCMVRYPCTLTSELGSEKS